MYGIRVSRLVVGGKMIIGRLRASSIFYARAGLMVLHLVLYEGSHC